MSDETKGAFTPGATYNLTTINVQGDDQEAFEVYADESREQTIAFVFDEKLAALVAACPDMLAALVLCVEDYEDGLVETDAWQMLHIGKVERPPTPYHIMAARAAIAKAREG